jgi:hypothetical protein
VSSILVFIQEEETPFVPLLNSGSESMLLKKPLEASLASHGLHFPLLVGLSIMVFLEAWGRILTEEPPVTFLRVLFGG